MVQPDVHALRLHRRGLGRLHRRGLPDDGCRAGRPLRGRAASAEPRRTARHPAHRHRRGHVASADLGFAQRPYLLPTTLTIQDGAGDPNSLRWLVIVTAVAVLLVGPALALLYRLDVTDMLAADHDKDLVEAPESPRS